LLNFKNEVPELGMLRNQHVDRQPFFCHSNLRAGITLTFNRVQIKVPTGLVLVHFKSIFLLFRPRCAEPIYNIGDFSPPARVLEAAKAGFLVGKSI
jgi:hypothetical protein